MWSNSLPSLWVEAWWICCIISSSQFVSNSMRGRWWDINIFCMTMAHDCGITQIDDHPLQYVFSSTYRFSHIMRWSMVDRLHHHLLHAYPTPTLYHNNYLSPPTSYIPILIIHFQRYDVVGRKNNSPGYIPPQRGWRKMCTCKGFDTSMAFDDEAQTDPWVGYAWTRTVGCPCRFGEIR